jgi:formylglycine-generating enzyme required for sulfatase activity
MARLSKSGGSYCIDRYEASLVKRHPDGSREPWPGNRKVAGSETALFAVSLAGRKPQGYISGVQATQACNNSGKRLCEVGEWMHACRGPKATRYPYGQQRQADVCNDRYSKLDHHPVVRLFNANMAPGSDPALMWQTRWMNDPRLHELSHSVSLSGAFDSCTNDYGAYDMVGNLHEWVLDEAGTFVGGFFMDTYQNGEGCEYRTQAHPFDYSDYSTGFRCCSEVSEPTREAL